MRASKTALKPFGSRGIGAVKAALQVLRVPLVHGVEGERIETPRRLEHSKVSPARCLVLGGGRVLRPPRLFAVVARILHRGILPKGGGASLICQHLLHRCACQMRNSWKNRIIFFSASGKRHKKAKSQFRAP